MEKKAYSLIDAKTFHSAKDDNIIGKIDSGHQKIIYAVIFIVVLHVHQKNKGKKATFFLHFPILG